MTITEKILASAAGKEKVAPGEIVTVKVDLAMMTDIIGPRIEIAERLKELGARVWDPEKVVVVSDHYTPPATARQADIVKFTREWAQSQGIQRYHEYEGACHQILAEKGYIKPGMVAVGTDSHTCMGGAVGAFATGIGSTEMLGVLVTGEIWFKVPATIKVIWEGKPGAGVMAKDLILKTCGVIGHAGATYRALEFTGPAINALPMDERWCIANMAVEMGAKNGIIEADEVTAAFFQKIGVDEGKHFSSDPDAAYLQIIRLDAGQLEPQVACPPAVDQVHPIREVAGERIDQAYVGSCTGGRLNDLKAVAKILEGRKVAKNVRLLVSPASRDVYLEALKAGLLETIAAAGGVILAPTCGACVGAHSGLLAAGERCISATNRNFVGRMGSPQAEVYLASPATVAASAIEGRIADPRPYLEG
ncbi:MAG: 3-isopropylmalate/(R)-2-methylmalate dehydratase large subunit [Clostridia bacterium]|nr:3-isopropylmalate/(R)-2-methylmalate dehydratase large subunit [Clostridia bacterium]